MKGIRKTICVTAALLLSLTYSAEARKIRTKHSIPKRTEKSVAAENAEKPVSISIATDSIAFCDTIRPAIRFYGFDKTIGSSTESFFITNGLDFPLSGMEVEITYNDLKGRQLHRRKARIDCEIPAGETRRTDIKSWDTQKSFYFHQSAKPRRQATPFDVKLRLISIFFTENINKGQE